MPKPKDNTDRDRAIVAKHTLGMTHDAIAQEYGISRVRVGQIIKATVPRAPGEAERAEVAATLRRKYDELQRIVDSGTPRSSAIGKVVLYPEGHERAGQIVNDDSVRIRAIAEQAKLMTQYRAMFSCDITQAPAPLIDNSTRVFADVKQWYIEHPGYRPTPGSTIPPGIEVQGPAAVHAWQAGHEYRQQLEQRNTKEITQ